MSISQVRVTVEAALESEAEAAVAGGGAGGIILHAGLISGPGDGFSGSVRLARQGGD